MSARWAHRSRPCAGETANGDLALVLSDGEREAFVVVDALGHGPRAQQVAELAAAALRRASLVGGVEGIVSEVHGTLRGSRGAAMTIVLREGSKVTAAGVGNVALRFFGPSTLRLVPTEGVLGGRMRSLRVVEGNTVSGRLVLHSDGVSQRFDSALVTSGSLEEACERLLADHGVRHDDATVLIAEL